jgi:phosphate transport system substrate-binding protein
VSCAAAVLVAGQAQSLQAQTTVKLNGAPPIAQPVKNKQADIEGKSGAKLEVLFTNNPKGLEALRAGEADVALLAPSVKKVVDAMNAAKPGSASTDGLQEFIVGEGSVSVIVNPNNAVSALTAAQARDIFSGKVTNWKDVGGADAAIQVFVLDPSIIPRIVIEEKVMSGTPVSKDAVVRSKPTDVVAMVSQTANAISFTGTALVTAEVKAVKFDAALKFPMVFVTKGEPTASVKSVIEATKAALGGGLAAKD